MSEDGLITPRRGLLGGLGLAAVGAAATASAAPRRAPTAAVATGWAPTPEAVDAWMDKPSRHRLAFDTVSLGGAEGAMEFAENFYLANASGYGLKDADLAVVIVMRHFSTPFAFDDAIWAKYASAFWSIIAPGPLAANLPKANPFKTAGARSGPGPERTITLPDLAKRGVQLAVCGMATEAFAGMIAGRTGGAAATIKAELIAAMLPGAHQVPAGIVAVNRLQEHGYAFSWAG